MNNQTRRNALKKLTSSTVGTCALLNLTKWVSPAIVLQVLPVHAQATTSPGQPSPGEPSSGESCLGITGNNSMCLDLSVRKPPGSLPTLNINGAININNVELIGDEATCLASNETVEIITDALITITGPSVDGQQAFTFDIPLSGSIQGLSIGEAVSTVLTLPSSSVDIPGIPEGEGLIYSVFVSVTFISGDPRFDISQAEELNGTIRVFAINGSPNVESSFNAC